MKYFLQTLWHFFQQIPVQVTKLIQQPPSRPAAPTPTTKPRSLPFIKKKRKTFRSFLREDSRSIPRCGSSASGRLRPSKMSRWKRRQRHKFLLGCEQEDNKEVFTNELQPEWPAIFQDKNGFEISAIVPASPPPYKEEQERVCDSDEELLRLFCEAQASAAAEPVRCSGRRSTCSQRGGLEWWEMEVEDGRRETWCSLASGGEQGKKHNVHVKVIILIDLTLDEDRPAVHHVPLSLLY